MERVILDLLVFIVVDMDANYEGIDDEVVASHVLVLEHVLEGNQSRSLNHHLCYPKLYP